METPTTTAIDLTPFCEPDTSGRYGLDVPWVVDGWRYATDGKVIVRVPASGEPNTLMREDGRRRPNPVSILPPVDGEWRPWPHVEPCWQCAGSRTMTCAQCSGDGTCQRCACGNEHDCGKCDGEGKATCDECNGLNSFKESFGKTQLALCYIWIISKLPKVEWLPAEKVGGVVRFRFDGGEGAVMGLSEK